jgi:signal transduction histidine kinase
MRSVLIVDDSAADRVLFRTILGRAGYSVYEVARGGDALEKTREVRPHVVILDVNLPDLNGLDVCRSIRADREIGDVPVLMLTVRHDDADILAGLEAGADDYVAKDAASAIVLERVRRLIQFRQMSSLAMLNQQLVQIGRLLTGIIHEIRGPLSVIRGSAELLRMDGCHDAESMQWVDSILRNAQLLQVRLDHLMATVRHTSSDAQLVELSPLVQEAAELFEKGLPLAERDVEVVTRCECPSLRVRVDYGRLMQVLLNLLNNAHQALRSVAQGGRIQLRSAKFQDRERPWVIIDVVDDGPGIPEAYINRIFEPFFTTREGGTGYGLYFASEIIKEQGGRLSVRNNEGRGATFTIWLPDDTQRESQERSADGAPAPAASS